MLKQILDNLTSLAELIGSFRKDHRELADNALRAVSHALNETLIYYKTLDNGGPRNEEVENQLVKYWSAAAIPMRHIDANFAEICEYKSQYWLNPEMWSEGKIREFNIGLNKVRSLYRVKLAKPSLFNKRNI